jgi:type IV pilus assembly protein PilV
MRGAARRGANGFSLIEVLIAIIVLSFGLLALAHVVGRSSQQQMEAVQRTQGMALVQDMIDRINDNRKQAAAYVGDYIPAAGVEQCDGAPSQVAADQCEWRNRLRGVDAYDARRLIGAPLGARACITNPEPNVYIVAVAWQGVLATTAPAGPCGTGAFGPDANRRVHSAVVQIAQLGA